MRVALCSTSIPFIDGGARNIVEWLATTLRDRGHDVETVYIPEYDDPSSIYRQMMAFRWIDLEAADRVICFRPQSHLVRHPHKIVWFIHHLREFYDLWDSPYRNFPATPANVELRRQIWQLDSAALREAKQVFTNSAIVADRLRIYNQIDSEVLYPPVLHSERFTFRSLGDEIVYLGRIEHHKRPHLLVEALALTTTPVRLRLCGTGFGPRYNSNLRARISALGLVERVLFENRWVSEEEKVSILADALAVAYLPVDEDSYGYPTLEAAYSSKPILTATDSGGVLEFVEAGQSGMVVEPTPEAIASAMDELFCQRTSTAAMGLAARRRADALNISWDHVVERLLA